MPHVDNTVTLHDSRRPRARPRVDPAVWAWAVVALMALVPLTAALA